MAGFLSDDEYLAMAVLRLCDAHDERINATERQACIDRARQSARSVLDRGKPKQASDITPAEEPEGEDR